MNVSTLPESMTSDQMIALTKQHTLFEWSARAPSYPIPVSGAKGCWF